ncbi:MAG: DUF3108 domain-containing protein [Gemmatimonadales bacterium]|nr:DUF3108 domain-containing protein [Gemmatimonadales bacterium]
MQLTRLAVLATLLIEPAAPYPFAVGETLRYDARVGPLQAGTATARIARTASERGRPVFVITMTGTGGPPGLRGDYQMTSWVGIDRFTSRRFHRRVSVAGRVDDRRFEIVPDSLRYREEGARQAWVSPAAPLDELAMLYYLRTLPLSVGETRVLRGYFRNGYNPVTVRVTGRQNVLIGSGASVGAFAIRVTSAGTASDVWLSDDARRVPVQLELPLSFGRARLVLRAMP